VGVSDSINLNTALYSIVYPYMGLHDMEPNTRLNLCAAVTIVLGTCFWVVTRRISLLRNELSRFYMRFYAFFLTRVPTLLALLFCLYLIWINSSSRHLGTVVCFVRGASFLLKFNSVLLFAFCVPPLLFRFILLRRPVRQKMALRLLFLLSLFPFIAFLTVGFSFIPTGDSATMLGWIWELFGLPGRLFYTFAEKNASIDFLQMIFVGVLYLLPNWIIFAYCAHAYGKFFQATLWYPCKIEFSPRETQTLALSTETETFHIAARWSAIPRKIALVAGLVLFVILDFESRSGISDANAFGDPVDMFYIFLMFPFLLVMAKVREWGALQDFFIPAVFLLALFVWMVRRWKKFLFPYLVCSFFPFYYWLLTTYFFEAADSALVRAVEGRIPLESYIIAYVGAFLIVGAVKFSVAFLTGLTHDRSARKIFLRCWLVGGGILTACFSAFVFMLRREGGRAWAVAFIPEWGATCFFALATSLIFGDYVFLNREGDKKANCQLAVCMNVAMWILLLIFSLWPQWGE
jgi:hypothetical protein